MAEKPEFTIDMKRMRSDAVKAFNDARPYHAELADIYKFFMPFRQSTQARSSEGGTGQGGEQRTQQLFDATGPSAAFNFAGNMQDDWTPVHQEIFKLQPGPLVNNEELRENLQTGYDHASNVLHAFMPKVNVQLYETYLDLFAGTGALLMPPGDGSTNLMPARAVPINEIAFREGPFGQIWHVWWKRNYRADDVPVLWPDGEISDTLKRSIEQSPETLVEVCQYTWYDTRDKRWHLLVWCDAQADSADQWIWHETFRTNQWITPRFFKVPGETYGRGLAHLGLPFVKTTNKARELQLLAAAFAVMGIWTYRDDGVFNPETAEFAPMALWPVQSNGGYLGKTVERLPVPQDFDISSVVIADERDQSRRVLLDDEMPDEQLAVRSATEIAGRLRRYARRRGGTGARLAVELVEAMVQRGLDVLERQGKLKVMIAGEEKPTAITIDNLTTQLQIVAPAAASQRADKVERAVRWIEMVTMMLGPEAAMLVSKVEVLTADMGRWMGNEEKYIRTHDERKQLTEMVAQVVAQQQQAKQQQEAKPPTPFEQQAQFVNGAM